MAEETTQRHRRYYYQLPTRLNVEDKLLTFGPLSLTLRQGIVVVLGGCLAMQVWRNLEILTLLGTFGLIAQVILTSLPLLATCICAFVRIADRHCEEWCVVLWRYYWLPKALVWKPVPASIRHLKEIKTPQRRGGKRRSASGSWTLDEESE